MAHAAPPHATTPGEDARYLMDLVSLRTTLRRNERDARLTGAVTPEGGSDRAQILYMLDASVLIFGINPPGDAHNVRVFHGWRGLDPRTEAAVAVTTAAHVFSGRLPGQGVSPYFVDPGHWREFVDETARKDWIRELLDWEARARGAIPDYGDLRTLVSLLDGGAGPQTPPRERLRTIREIVKKIAALDLNEAAAAEHLRQLLKRNLPGGGRALKSVTALPYLPDGFWSAEDRPASDEWETVLTKIEAERPSPHLKRPEAIRADAVALARLRRVNRYFADQALDARLVLVTTDESLFDAVARRPFARDRAGDPHLRRLVQYTPLQNVRDMANGIASTEPFDKLLEAIDARLLLRPLNEPDAPDPLGGDFDARLAEIDVRAKRDHHVLLTDLPRNGAFNERQRNAIAHDLNTAVRSEFARVFDDNRNELTENWKEILTNSAPVNYDLFAGYYKEGLRDVFDMLAALGPKVRGDIGTAYLETQRTAMRRLARAHLEASLLVELGAEGAELWARDDLGLCMGNDRKSKATKDMTVDVLAAMQRNDWAEVAEAAERLFRSTAPVPVIALAAAALALQGGAWRTAARFADFIFDDAHQDSGNVDQHQHGLIRARATLFAAMALRARRLDDPDETESSSEAADTRKRLRKAAGTFRRAGRPLEAAEAVVEMAQDAVTRLVVDLVRRRPLDQSEVKKRLAEIAADAHDALQEVDLSEGRDGARTLCDEPLAPIIRARTGHALLMGGLIAQVAEATPPFLMSDVMKEHAASHLAARFTGGVDPGIWGLLVRWARDVAPRHLIQSLDALDGDKPTTAFKTEVDFLRRAFASAAADDLNHDAWT